MRDEIEQRIKNSGTAGEEAIKESYKRGLIKCGRPESEIEKMLQNEAKIQMMLHSIDLGNCKIQDKEIAEIAQMIVNEKPETRQIALYLNDITDEGAIKMAGIFVKLKHLSWLDVQGNKIGKRGLYALFTLSALKPELHLSLCGTKVDDATELWELEEKAKKSVRRKMTP